MVVVTGGNSGIGYSTAKEFKNQGATVVITGKRQDALEKASNDLGVIGKLADQSSIAEIEKLAADIKESFGKVDVLFINAGVASFAPIEYTTAEQFDTMANVNFKGSFFMLQKFIPILKEGSSVIFLTSNATALSMENSAVYSATKSAISQLAKIAAKELAPKKIRVNIIAPGPTETEMLDKFGVDAETLKGMKVQMAERVPMGKLGIPEDIAKMVIYLADDSVSSFITGTEIFIDGGMSL